MPSLRFRLPLQAFTPQGDGAGGSIAGNIKLPKLQPRVRWLKAHGHESLATCGHRKSHGRRHYSEGRAAASRDRSDIQRGIPRIAYNKRSLFLRFSYDYSAKVQGRRVHVDLRHRRGAYPLHPDIEGEFIRVSGDGKCPGLRPGKRWRKAHGHAVFAARGDLKRHARWHCTEVRVVATDGVDFQRGAADVFHLQILVPRLPDGHIAKARGNLHVDVSPP